MIHEVKQPSSSILALNCPFPEARAIIEGNNPGWVFADDRNRPRAALVWAQGMEGFYLVGEAKSAVFLEELDAYTEEVLRPRLDDCGVAWFEISGDESWNPVIESAFSERDLEKGQQWVYTLEPTRHQPVNQRQTAGDGRVRKVDRHLLTGLSGASREFVCSRLTRFWGSLDAFLHRGLGYGLVDGGEIVSVCCSGFVAGNIHVIDIETKGSHRRRGYAETVARAFVAECIEKQLQPHWDCMAENMASARLAEKLSFTRSRAYTLYSFPLRS